LATALASTTPTLAALAFAAAAVSVFFLHEPVLVLLGRRGKKARTDGASRCWQRVGLLGASACFFATLFVALAPRVALVGALLPAVLGGVVASLVWFDREKTAVGELAAAGALSAVAVPVALASGAPGSIVAAAWAAWCIGLGASTWSVRSVIARAKNTTETRLVALGIPAGTLSVVALGFGARPFMLAAPMLCAASAIALAHPHPRHLRRVGWSLVAASTATAVLLVVAARA
jgi:hypothetical protein